MSENENTATKPDVYSRVTSQIVNAIEQGVEQLAHAVAHLGKVCIFAHQRHEQETLSGHQHGLPVGYCTSQRLRPWRMGHVPAMARAKCPGPQGRERTLIGLRLPGPMANMLAVHGGCFAGMNWCNSGNRATHGGWRSIAARLGIPVMTAVDAYRDYCTETVAQTVQANMGN
jgi:hypothetical protein